MKTKSKIINIKKITTTAKIPTKGSISAAGYDLYADISEPVFIPPHCTIKISTNIIVEIPNGYFGAIYARSGMATNRGLRPCNCTGVIDSDYRGNVVVALYNDSDCPQIVEVGERIAQMIVQPYLNVEFNECGQLTTTERGHRGFGSTGEK